MRCKNCGWPNKPGETVCVKCNSPLEADDVSETRLENSYEDYGSKSGMNIGATIPENAFFANSEVKDETVVCPKCGYPVRVDAAKCPNCNYELSRAANIIQGQFENTNNKPIHMNNSSKKTVAGTINPYMVQAEQEPTFILKPQQRINEKKVLAEMEYEGKEVVLTRENTEPDNGSITSQEQAVVFQENGRWYIEDKSEHGTTFVRATNKIELNDGDMILLGNRLFEFHK